MRVLLKCTHENNYEIPATITDIYTDFVAVLLGKLEVKDKNGLLLFNIKRRLFTVLALHMLDNNIYEIDLSFFKEFINKFLIDRGYQLQNDDDINDLIEKSGLLYQDENNMVGFKQIAFVEFLASVEIYHNQRDTHYKRLVENFNDINWQNTAIFYAGQSKELVNMIDDVVEKAPNLDIKDRFMNVGGMGYLSQALYQTKPKDRKKLVFKSLDNLMNSINEIKEFTRDEKSLFYNMPYPLMLTIISFWFTENFKSITLKQTLVDSFGDLEMLNFESSKESFENDLKLLIISSTLYNTYIADESYLLKLFDKPSFMKHPILPLVADMIIDLNNGTHLNPEYRRRIAKEIKKKREYIKDVLKEPAYRYGEDFIRDDDYSISP